MLKNKKQKGQALFEFIVFVPFLLMLYSLTLTISNAFNASINQQKTTRGYFYYTGQNDSYLPSPSRGGGADFSDSFRLFSMSIIGWADRLDGQFPVAPCFELRMPIGDLEDDACDASYNEDKTQFIRVGTVYGVCGANYVKEGPGVGVVPFSKAGNTPLLVTDPTLGCAIRQ